MQKKFLDFCNVKGPDSKYLNRQGGFWDFTQTDPRAFCPHFYGPVSK